MNTYEAKTHEALYCPAPYDPEQERFDHDCEKYAEGRLRGQNGPDRDSASLRLSGCALDALGILAAVAAVFVTFVFILPAFKEFCDGLRTWMGVQG